MAEDIGLFEAIYSQRALRYFKPDPVDDNLIWKILDAGIRAPSGSNSQGWDSWSSETLNCGGRLGIFPAASHHSTVEPQQIRDDHVPGRLTLG